MKNLLIETWGALLGVLTGVADLFVTVFAWAWSVLLILHNDMPRLEGLLVGVLLAWFFVHREKNPIVRALAAPLKIVLDILDIVWDETVEALADLLGSAKAQLDKAVGWVKDGVKSLLSKSTNALLGLKDRIVDLFNRKKDSE